jgi:ribosomal protein L31
MEVVAVLSHLMSKDGELDEETLARVKAAVEVANNRKCKILITSGWAYRNDSPLAIGNIVSDYIVRNFDLNACTVLSDISSRDTVGDAFYLRRRLREFPVSKLVVVTSDYHVVRAKIIFKAFFEPAVSVEVIGAESKSTREKSVLKHECASLQAFHSTFKGVDFESDDEVIKAMSECHPFYNGTVHPSIR